MKNITIIGKVNGNIYTHQFESGSVKARVPVLVRETRKSSDGGESVRETSFTVEVWNNTALYCTNKFKEGNSIFVDGDLDMVSFNNREGKLDARLVIAARKVLTASDEAYVNFRGIGNLTRDPEMRYTNEAGLPVTNAGIAFNRRYLDSAGERQEETLFADLVAWNGTAENLDQYTQRGSRLYMESNHVELEFYASREGEPKVRTKITASFTQFLSPSPGQAAPAHGAPVTAEGAPEPDDDMPW
ncbi:MAG: single-stranded DNA-binding protein [Chloroflexi bacterium]|nr:single-stranded DNA-binding protein [Chloroflexota bacterium]